MVTPLSPRCERDERGPGRSGRKHPVDGTKWRRHEACGPGKLFGRLKPAAAASCTFCGVKLLSTVGGNDMSQRLEKVAEWEAEALQPDDSEACFLEQVAETVLFVPTVVTDVDIRWAEATPAGGYGEEEHSRGQKQLVPLPQRGLVGFDVFEDLKCTDEIEAQSRIKLGEVTKDPPTLTERRQPPPSLVACPRIRLDPGVVVSGGKADGECTLTRADLKH
jgi:hypothetical protein